MKKTTFKPVAEQLEYLKKGCVEIIQENELRAKLERSHKTGAPLQIKVGFDPTAPDLHLGHTVILRKMKHFQDLGHTVVFLIGDFTGLIGDPSGRSATRPPMTREEINRNAETYKVQVFKVLDPAKTVVDFNSRWLGALTSFDIIKLAAKHTVARILERDDFTKRLKNGQPISVHEMLYPLMQAYDSVALKTDVEMGGTDQKFNLLVGRDIQREFGQEPQVVMTLPLLEGTDGVEKMSKSLGNTIGVTEPAAEIFGKVMSISDDLMYKYYELLTDVPSSLISQWKKEAAQGKVNPRDLKAQLAEKLAADFWGRPEAKRALDEFEKVFKRKEIPADIEEIVVGSSQVLLLDLLVDKKILPSRGEFKRLVQQGGISLDGRRVEDISLKLDMKNKKEAVLKIGKRKFYRLLKK
jgi:tyrosyl-tRNA synthetase